MGRYAIDAVTLLYLLDSGSQIDATHQLVASNSIRSDALQLLLADVRRGKRTNDEVLAIHEPHEVSHRRTTRNVARWLNASDHAGAALR